MKKTMSNAAFQLRVFHTRVYAWKSLNLSKFYTSSNGPYRLFIFYPIDLLFRVKNLLEFYAEELNDNFVIEPEIKRKEFRVGKHWNIIFICVPFIVECGNMETRLLGEN